MGFFQLKEEPPSSGLHLQNLFIPTILKPFFTEVGLEMHPCLHLVPLNMFTWTQGQKAQILHLLNRDVGTLLSCTLNLQ